MLYIDCMIYDIFNITMQIYSAAQIVKYSDLAGKALSFQNIFTKLSY